MSVPTTAGGDDTGLDSLDELPPLDGAEDDAPPQTDADAELDADESPGGLDDSTGVKDEAEADELDLDERGVAWLNEAPDAADLNIGEDFGLDLLEVGAPVEADDEGPGAEDLGVGEGVEAGGLDSGEEGPQGPDEELRDEDLPDLGTAEEDEIDAAALESERFSGDEPMGLKWAARPWSRVGAPTPFASASASAVACAARGALVSGRVESGPRELLRIDLEGGCQNVAAEGLGGMDITSLSVEGDLVVAVVQGGGVFLSQNGGVRFDLLSQEIMASSGVLASGALWVRTKAGDLYLAVRGANALEKREVGASVAALTSDGAGRVVALVADAASRPIALLRGGADGTVEREAIEGPEPCVSDLVAARGGHLAYPGRRGVVRRGSDGIWRNTAWQGSVGALTFVDSDGLLVAASYSEPDDTTGLVQIDSKGSARVVALLGPPTQADIEADGRALALACDEPRGVVWAAGSFGVVAFSTR